MLEDDARKQLALQCYLSQLYDDQVAFGVKQRNKDYRSSSWDYFRIGVIFGAAQFTWHGCSSSGGLCESKYDVSIACSAGEARGGDTT